MEQTEQVKETASMRKTKRALIASAICTLLCGLLLFSTSIAWFSSTKESAANELCAGNLDIVLSYSKDMETWNEVDSETDGIFKVNNKNMLWEPGAVNVVYFKVENKGSLAAKYDFALVIGAETTGKNFDNHEFKLSDYIMGGVVKDISDAYADTDDGRAQARAAVESAYNYDVKTLQQIHTGAPLLTGTLTGVPETGTETAGNTEKVFALVLYMPENTSSDTNYRTPEGENPKRPKVPLSVKLVATQDVGESDSFGSEYDKGAYEIKVVVPTLAGDATDEERKNAIDNAVAVAVQSAEPGSTIRLPETTGEETIVLPSIPANITIKGDGNTKVVLANNVYGASAAAITEGATLENIILDCGDSLYHGFQHSGPIEFKDCKINGKLTLYGPTVFTNCTINTTTATGADYIWTYGCDVTFDGCTFNTLGKAILCYNEANGSGYNNVTVKNCRFNASSGAKAGAIANQNCAAIEIDNYGCGVNLTLSNNTVQTGDNAFSGEWRIKSYYPESTDDKIIVNGVEYTSIALDGKTMTIDGSKNVTVNN